MTCNKCGINYKMLTKGNLCAICFKKDEGYWPSEFCSDTEKERRSKGGIKT